jgi:predicted Fe-Mo cluster-binding NifX family protein
MKLALSSDGNDLEAMLDSRFGRAKRFVIYDTESGAFEILDNAQNLSAAQGAGIQSAQNIAAAGAQALVTGHTGPKAFSVLQKAQIPVYHCEPMPLKKAIEAFKQGKLPKAESADVESHW